MTEQYKTIEDAFSVVDRSVIMPFKTIEYIRQNSPSPEIIKRLAGHFLDFSKNQHDDGYLEVNYLRTMYYLIIAEKNVSQELIDPLIQLTAFNEQDDCFDAEIEYIIHVFSKAYPKETVEAIMKFIDKIYEDNTHKDYAYLFLVTAFYNADTALYKDWLIDLIENKNISFKVAFTNLAAEKKIKETIPAMQKLIEKEKDNDNCIFYRDFEEHLDLLKSGKTSDMEQTFFGREDDWQEYYKEGIEYPFLSEDDEEYYDYDDEDDDDMEDAPDSQVNKKVGRNDPCPCGSGKKYKKCCGK